MDVISVNKVTEFCPVVQMNVAAQQQCCVTSVSRAVVPRAVQLLEVLREGHHLLCVNKHAYDIRRFHMPNGVYILLHCPCVVAFADEVIAIVLFDLEQLLVLRPALVLCGLGAACDALRDFVAFLLEQLLQPFLQRNFLKPHDLVGDGRFRTISPISCTSARFLAPRWFATEN
uniref:Uncharacterized protein n=1 Tax=Trypanosoma congolense (strain IL3000) TaxID=1068625 RepID=G0USY4_TRYCI|nr:hypothetical protein TCIL3000_8_7260 [Trypanosoma congolense IL3000]